MLNADSDYEIAIGELAERFGGRLDHTDLDDVVHFTEARARVAAAHMVGLALGLRLRGADLFAKGGAR